MKRSTINEITMWFLVLYVAGIPLFLGGNRPLVWIGAMFVIAIFSLAYFAAFLVTNERLAVLPKTTWPYFLMFGLFMAYQLLQTLPIAPGFLTQLPVDVPHPDTISVAPNETMMSFVRWFSIAMTGFLALQVSANRRRARRFMTLLFGVAVFQAVLAFALFFQFNDSSVVGEKWVYLGSLTGSFINRNTLATFLASGAVLTVAVFINNFLSSAEKGPMTIEAFAKAALIPAVAFVIIIIDIAASNSRMGVFVTGLGVAVLAMLTARFGVIAARGKGKTAASSGLRPIIILLGLVLVLGVGAMYGTGVVERLGTIDDSADTRLSLYLQVWEMVTHRPLTGFGGGAFNNAYPLFHELPVSPDFIWDKAHNSYLALWSEYGLIFGSLPILIIGLAGYQMITSKKGKDALPALAAFSVIVLAAAHSLVDFSLEIQGYTLYFVAIVGCGLASVLVTTRSERQR